MEVLDGEIKATSEKVDGVYAVIDSGSAGDENGSAGDETASAGAWSIMSAIAERDFAQAVRTDRVQAEIKDTSAAVEVVSKAQAELDGKASAMWSVKMQVNANGQLVTAGIGLGIETDANGVTQSQFLVSADRFAVVGALAGGQVFTPFVVQNGHFHGCWEMEIMKVTLSPQRRDDIVIYQKSGDTLLVNGEGFDFSKLEDGDVLPREAIKSEWFSGGVTRVDGELWLGWSNTAKSVELQSGPSISIPHADHQKRLA